MSRGHVSNYGLVIIVFCAAGFIVSLAADDNFLRQDSENFERKAMLIVQNGLTELDEQVLTTVTEDEVNAYLMFQGSERMPSAITEVRLTMGGEGRLTGQAVVDLDEIVQQSVGGWPAPLSYLSGRLEISAEGVLSTSDGVGHLDVEAVRVAGVPVPQVILFEILRYYSRTPEDLAGSSLSDSFDLPARIREIRVGSGKTVIVQ